MIMAEATEEEVISNRSEKGWTYTNENGRYDATLLSDAGRIAFSLLLEVNAEIQVLGKRTAVLQAAAAHFNGVIQGGLTEEALIEPIEDEDGASENSGDEQD
jgi:hypothetical protein